MFALRAAIKKNFEARNPKFETIANVQNKQNSKQVPLEFVVSDFPDLRFVWIRVCFEFRYSDFGFLSLLARRGSCHYCYRHKKSESKNLVLLGASHCPPSVAGAVSGAGDSFCSFWDFFLERSAHSSKM